MDNIFLPRMAIIKEIIDENSQIKTFVTAFTDPEYKRDFIYDPGQFMMISIPHHGEAPISISSTPTRPGTMHFSVRKAGRLTAAMFECKIGDRIGLRGPYGRPFPVDRFGGDLVFVAGGIGLAPLRAVINYVLDTGGNPARKFVLYGSRTPADLAFQADFAAWTEHPEVTTLLTVDAADADWGGPVGVVPALLDQIEVNAATSTAVLCGPPIMIRFTMEKLTKLGFAGRRIWTTMERHMKCGLGTCGHCYINGTMICVEGPVFNGEELKKLGPEELIASSKV